MASLIPYRYKAPSVRSFFQDDFFRPFFSDSGRECFRVDVSDQGESYLLEADLPGLSREKIHVDVEDGVLTISTEGYGEEERRDGEYIYSERRAGQCARSFSLNQIDEEHISARYEDGVLRVTLPKTREEKRGKSVEIE